MASHLGLAICPWGALVGGNYKTEEQIAELKKHKERARQIFPPSDADRVVLARTRSRRLRRQVVSLRRAGLIISCLGVRLRGMELTMSKCSRELVIMISIRSKRYFLAIHTNNSQSCHRNSCLNTIGIARSS
jgi:hypothetical protein